MYNLITIALVGYTKSLYIQIR